MTSSMSFRLEDLLVSFRQHLGRQQGPPAIELYCQGVRCFSRWLAELAEMCQPNTVATRLRGMRRFCRWLVIEGEVDKAPTEGAHAGRRRGVS